MELPPLEGAHLGARHKHLNNIIKTAIEKQTPFETIKQLQENNDIVPIFKIRMAAHYRNVDYILQVLKCDDIFYVSKAISSSVWLLEGEYSKIINPVFLNQNLYPYMMSNAIGKLNLMIRLNLKIPLRVEEFASFYFEKQDINTGFKWLQRCSFPFKTKYVIKHFKDIRISELKKICETDPKILDVIIENVDYNENQLFYINLFICLKNLFKTRLNMVEQFLTKCSYQFQIGKRMTRILLKLNREMVIKHFMDKHQNIELSHFVSSLKENEIRNLLLKTPLNYFEIELLIKYLPEASRFEFVRRVFLDLEENSINATENTDSYRYYQYASFQTAFKEMKELIKTEKDSVRRIDMLKTVLLTTSGNQENLYLLLKYFFQRHLNEPVNLRLKFMSKFIEMTKTHTFNDKLFQLLTEIMHNFEVFKDIEGVNNSSITFLIEELIFYNVIKNIEMPPQISKYLQNNPVIAPKPNKFTQNELHTIFKYLEKKILAGFDFEKRCLKSYTLNMSTFYSLERLFSMYEKNMVDDPEAVEIIKKLIESGYQFKPKDRLSLNRISKSMKRHLFEKFFMLSPYDVDLLYILRHNSDLLAEHKAEIFDSVRELAVSSLYLNKLRIYFDDSLYHDFLSKYLEELVKLENDEIGSHDDTTKKICILMRRNLFEKMIVKYIPTELKVSWSTEPLGLLNTRQYFAKNLQYVRPLMDLSIAASFSSGDYLQWVFHSLQSICDRLPKSSCKDYIPLFLEGPTSLRKYAIRVASRKLELREFLSLTFEQWNDVKSPSIKAVSFIYLFKKLQDEQSEEDLWKGWEILSQMISQITIHEDTSIYPYLSYFKLLPKPVRAMYFMKSYKILKDLPKKLNCEIHFKKAVSDSIDLVNEIDDSYFVEIILENLENLERNYEVDDFILVQMLSIFLTKSATDEILHARYAAIMPKTLQCIERFWSSRHDTIRSFTENLIKSIFVEVIDNNIKKEYVRSVWVINKIRSSFETFLAVDKYYDIFADLELQIAFCESFTGFYGDYASVHQNFVEKSLKILENHRQSHFPGVDFLFRTKFRELVFSLNTKHLTSVDLQLDLARCLIEDDSSESRVLLAIELLPLKVYNNEHLVTLQDIISKIKNMKENKSITYNFYFKFKEHKPLHPAWM